MKPGRPKDAAQGQGQARGVSVTRVSVFAWYALTLGLFLGLAILKFGNPVILDERVGTPANAEEFFQFAWPTRWAYWGLIPLLVVGATMAFGRAPTWPRSPWLWVLPLVWFGWQCVSATRTVDAQLTTAVLYHFSGCLGCYFVGAFVVGRKGLLVWLLAGLLAAFTWCLIRAANQRLVEFPREHADLVAGQQCGWTNFSPEVITQLKLAGVIVTTNGVDVANPVILAKYAKGRVHGTVVYPNALAGLIILLLPVALALLIARAGKLRPSIRFAALSLTVLLGLGGLYWTGSKLGWLVSLGVAGLGVFRLDWPRRLKLAVLACVLVVGLATFAWRFQSYFSAGAKSAGARLDYWRAAAQVFVTHPVFGTGPGTFQRPYEAIKCPESEMARLVHNDYLEQFSDSGAIGGLAYVGWIVLGLVCCVRSVCRSSDMVWGGVVLGLTGWFVHGLGEFSLYVPALAWTAFIMLGSVVGRTTRNGIDSQDSTSYAFVR